LGYSARLAARSSASDGRRKVGGASFGDAFMIGLVIVTHGGLASEFLAAMEHVVGPQRGVAAICIGPEDDMERRRRDIVDAANAVNDGDGVILLTDMFGGTPSNLAISVMEETQAEVIAGLNLPMLIKLASVRGREPLESCVAHAQDAGRKYISVASWVLQGEK
jgi:PTS system mannose-specific IIA component